jgi:hypothetical protein
MLIEEALQRASIPKNLEDLKATLRKLVALVVE